MKCSLSHCSRLLTYTLLHSLNNRCIVDLATLIDWSIRNSLEPVVLTTRVLVSILYSRDRDSLSNRKSPSPCIF